MLLRPDDRDNIFLRNVDQSLLLHIALCSGRRTFLSTTLLRPTHSFPPTFVVFCSRPPMRPRQPPSQQVLVAPFLGWSSRNVKLTTPLQFWSYESAQLYLRCPCAVMTRIRRTSVTALLKFTVIRKHWPEILGWKRPKPSFHSHRCQIAGN